MTLHQKLSLSGWKMMNAPQHMAGYGLFRKSKRRVFMKGDEVYEVVKVDNVDGKGKHLTIGKLLPKEKYLCRSCLETE